MNRLRRRECSEMTARLSAEYLRFGRLLDAERLDMERLPADKRKASEAVIEALEATLEAIGKAQGALFQASSL